MTDHYGEARTRNRASTRALLKRSGYADGGDVDQDAIDSLRPDPARDSADIQNDPNKGGHTYLTMSDATRNKAVRTPGANSRGDSMRQSDKIIPGGRSRVPTLGGALSSGAKENYIQKPLMSAADWNQATESDAQALDSTPYHIGNAKGGRARQRSKK